MRLLHRINLDVPAGVEHQFCALIGHAAMQSAFDHDLVYGSGMHSSLAPSIQPFVRTAESFKRAGRLRLPRWPAVLRQQRVIALIRHLDTDAIVSWSGFARDLVTEAARRSATPLIYREGGGAWFEHSPAAARRFTREIRGAICNTHASMRMLQLKWGYDGPARVCLGGIRPGMLAAADLDTDRTVHARTRPRIGVAARLASEKGVCLAIHALKHLHAAGIDCVMDIAGDGPDRAGLEVLAEALGVASRLRFLGMVQDMPSFYRSLDILLHPALQEPLGNVTIEAQAFGVPVVATCVDGMAETIRDGETGRLVAADQPYDRYPEFGGTPSGMQSSRVYDPDMDALRPATFARPEALADAVATIFAEPGRHARMATAARQHAREAFAFDRYIVAFIDAVHEFMDRAGGHA